jgi:hypothetical protein
MPEGKKANKSKKNRKYNRDRVKCARYAAEHRRTRNNPARTRRNPERSPH